MKIGLVYEGGSDLTLLKELFSSLKDPSGDSIEIIPLQPIFDATTKKSNLGGWTEIRKWCEKYSNNKNNIKSIDPLERAKAKFYWKALLPLSSINSLMIQIDTDIADIITGLPKSLNHDFHGHKKNYMAYVVSHWLNEKTLNNNECYTLITSSSIESWILAVHDRGDPVFEDLPIGFDFEEISDPEPRLISLGYNVGTKSGRLIKNNATYINYAQKIISNYNKVKDDIDSLDQVTNFLTT